MAYDLQDPLPGFNAQTGSPTYSYYMNAWQPGGDVVEYPPDWGIAVPPGSDFVGHRIPSYVITDVTMMNGLLEAWYHLHLIHIYGALIRILDHEPSVFFIVALQRIWFDSDR